MKIRCPQRSINHRYRNRRIGEFLKEPESTEGRSTGIPKMLRVMAENGSPLPVFETDEDRTHYLVRLPVHANADWQDLAADKLPDKLPDKQGLSRDQVKGPSRGQVEALSRHQVKILRKCLSESNIKELMSLLK